MTDLAKLRVAELKVLKKEEETLNSILSMYRNTLNALKVEELTLFKQLGTAQDLERQSRNSTPSIGGLASSRSDSQCRSRTQSRDSMASSPTIDNVQDLRAINKSSLNLSTAPLLNRFLEDQEPYEEEEEEENE